ncbi:MAG: amino acid racemase [Pseudonocardia sp.]|nr:amino acid racemase [Pseudonocardia sp.]
MRTIGLIGGMSWHSTASYYRIINETVAHRRGGHASAPIALQSLDFATVRQHQIDGDWTAAGDLLREAARKVVAGGADVVAICTNLMHEVAPAVEGTVDVPLLHIADAVAASPAANGWDRLGVLGARRVMEDGFYTERLARHGISAITPAAADRELVDRVVFTELTRGQIRDDSRAAFVGVIERLAGQGAQAVVLACTEIGLLVGDGDGPLPLIDSTDAHARALAEFALASR